jgi:hypothetical protein
MRRDVVLTTTVEQEAFDLEIRLIAQYHTYIRDPLYNGIGCNLTVGGDGISGINERVVEQYIAGELIATFSSVRELAASFGMKPETISNALAGRGVMPICMRGSDWIIEPSRRRARTANHGNSMAVVQLNPMTGKVVAEHTSLTDAQKATGLRYTVLAKALRQSTLAGGFGWSFKDPTHVTTRHRTNKSNSPTGSKPVVITIDGVDSLFPSVLGAARHLQVNPNKLLATLHGDGYLGEIKCRFNNDVDLAKRIERSDEWRANLAGVNGQHITKLDASGNVVKVYASFAVAERSEGFMARELYNGLQDNDVITIGDFTWKRAV